ncbi:hypothetical protein AWENTII_006142 [Aspergillus wentii]
MSNSGDHTSPKRSKSPITTNVTSHLSQADHIPHSATVASPVGLPAIALPEIGMLSTFSTGIMGKVPSQPGFVSPESSSISANMFQNPWKGQGSEMENLQQFAIEDRAPCVPQFQNRVLEDGGYTIDEGPYPSIGKDEKSRGKRQRGHYQKATLSKALQKANTAVLLDNAANFEGAMEAYNDACHLLQLVMLRSNGGDDEKLKLQEIRDTYMIRITELQRMDFSFQEADHKALPERPLSQESYGDLFRPLEDDEDEAFSGTSMSPLQTTTDFRHQTVPEGQKELASHRIPPRRQSLLPSAFDDEIRYATASPNFRGQHDRSHSELSWQTLQNERLEATNRTLHGGSPPTLSPREQSPEASNLGGDLSYGGKYSELSLLGTHVKDANESTSWLDTIDESGASSPSSMRSKTSSVYLRHKKNHHFSHGTEAEFDAALDAAVEAAYDDGLEPAVGLSDKDDDIVANARRNVELAKQKVREAEREAEVAMTRGREMRRFQDQEQPYTFDSDYLDEEAEEEERLLEEMTREYVMDDFEFDIQSKSALPRQSDSSSFSGRTWESSAASNTTTAGAALSTLAEDDVLPSTEAKIGPNTLPHLSSDSTLPVSIAPSDNPSVLPKQSSALGQTAGSVRARRMSGQELKIETSSRPRLGSDASGSEKSSDQLTSRPPPLPKDEPQTSLPIQASKGLDPTSALRSAMPSSKRNASISSFAEDTAANGNLSKALTQDDDDAGLSPPPARPIGKVPSAPDNLGKQNPGLKAFRTRNVSVPIPEPSADSPGTPSSSAFPTLDLHKGMAAGVVPILPTPTGASFTPNGLPSGGLYLFDSHIHSPTSPGCPNPMVTNAPMPLEPCPESFLLRPFWLMRCLYQTVTNPRGGYLSTKLFIPRDVWRVKNIKIKAVEEKVSNCDLLTAALLKLSQVDTYDADAVLEEMQSLESVLDQVQASLSKKLGNEVGVQGAMPLFRSSAASDDTATTAEIPPSKGSNGPSKSYLTSWRKLRSKNSGFGAAASITSSKETSKDNLTISSLPMTSTPVSQSERPNVTQLQFNGPNANYMGALARLCDAAQVLDQIAQQVEDPGLKHSSPTLVGLELSTRHAAEFFGFYVCRFALNDISVMLDKFIKRGSEWVLI